VTAPAIAAAAVAVDVAVFTVRDGALRVLLVQAPHGPFAGWWALPGGRIGAHESLDDAAHRELAARTGLRDVYLEQLYTFGSPERDPHDRVVAVAYVALIPDGGRFPTRDASAPEPGVAWQAVADLPRLAYDHGAVVEHGVARLRAKLGYTNLVYTLLPRTFTLSELQAMYEAILGRRLDRRNFRKKLLATGLLRPLGRVRRGAHRPAALYAFRRRRPMVIEIL
jgi:8-oxo-dGTP diphosphatase